MANLSQERYIKNPHGSSLERLQFGVAGSAAKIWEGAMVALSSAGLAVRGGTASSSHVVGVAETTVDNSAGAAGAVSIYVAQGAFWFGNSSSGDAITESEYGKIVYVVDDQTVAKTSNSNARAIAGLCLRVDSTLGVLVYISAVMNEALEADQSDLAADLASTAASLGASMVGIQDVATIYTATTVEGALAEVKTLVDAGMTVLKKTVTSTHSSLVAAAATETVNIGTALPANSRIVGVDFHTYTAFSGGTISDFTVDVGTSGDVDALIDGADLFAAAVDGGPATIPQGIRPNKFLSAGGQLIATFRCGSDDVADATAGAITIDVLYVVLA